MNGSFRLADFGVIAAIVVNIIIGTWEVAHLDGRVSAVEQNQIRYELQQNLLAKADSEKDIHFTKVDGAIESIKGQVTTTLSLVQRMYDSADPPIGSGDTNKEPNFTHPRR